jgi:hypothetical protein
LIFACILYFLFAGPKNISIQLEREGGKEMMKHHALLYALLLVLLVAVVASEGVVRDYQRSLEQDTWVIHVEEGVDIESVEIQLLAYGLTIISYPLDRLIMAEESGLNNVETESIAAINGVIAV